MAGVALDIEGQTFHPGAHLRCSTSRNRGVPGQIPAKQPHLASLVVVACLKLVCCSLPAHLNIAHPARHSGTLGNNTRAHTFGVGPGPWNPFAARSVFRETVGIRLVWMRVVVCASLTAAHRPANSWRHRGPHAMLPVLSAG